MTKFSDIDPAKYDGDFFELIMPNGKKLRECTREDLMKLEEESRRAAEASDLKADMYKREAAKR